MNFKQFSWYSWLISVGIFSFLVLLGSFGFNLSASHILSAGFHSVNNEYFVLDFVGFCLSLLTVLLALIIFYFFNVLNSCSVVFVLVSIVASILSFNSNHALLFWWFYEISILSLLYLLIVESPYSERYVAGWYLAGYVVLTSLPMLLCVIYFVVVEGSWIISEWQISGVNNAEFSYEVLLVLGVLFLTKIPLPPFHAWLPLVHAEATSVVSVCLSGYIMKLGLLGVSRFCWWVIPSSLFNMSYVSVVFFMSIIFFLVASVELDGKRWLAFLSLSHIVICVVCLNSALFSYSGLFLVYSVSHGLSAGLIFVFLWWGYELSGSRNWVVIKSVMGGSIFFRFLLCGCMCTAASLPPIMNFFVEVLILYNVGLSSLAMFFLFCCYLFFSSLIPFFLLGFLMSRHYCLTYSSQNGVIQFVMFVVFLLLWSFIIFLVI